MSRASGGAGRRLIDTNVLVGRDSRTGIGATPADIRAAFAPWGVTHACVASMEAVLYDADYGNAAVLELTRRDPFFLPVAVISPRDRGVAERVRRAKRDGFVFARLFPDDQGFAVDGPACRELLDACEATGLPVMLPLAAAGAAATARALAGRSGCYVFTSVRYMVQSDCLALARTNPGILVETSMLNTPDGVAEFARELGAARLVFGSGYPLLAPGCAHRVFRDSGLSDTDIGIVGHCGGLIAKTVAEAANGREGSVS